MSAQTGKITQVIGPVIDVSFNKESGTPVKKLIPFELIAS